MTQQEFSKLVGLNRKIISDYERGTRVPSFETIIKMSAALNIPPNEFFHDKGKSDFDAAPISLIFRKHILNNSGGKT